MNRYKQQNEFSIKRTKPANLQSPEDDLYTFHLDHLDKIAEMKNEEKSLKKKDQKIENNVLIFKAMGPKRVRRGMGVPNSSLAQIGIEDPRGYSNECREWIRGVENAEHAHEEFFSNGQNSQLPKDPRFWNDESIPDSAFAADVPIKDHRQVMAARPLVRRQF
jgi:hypothetical protein